MWLWILVMMNIGWWILFMNVGYLNFYIFWLMSVCCILLLLSSWFFIFRNFRCIWFGVFMNCSVLSRLWVLSSLNVVFICVVLMGGCWFLGVWVCRLGVGFLKVLLVMVVVLCSSVSVSVG